VFAYYLQLALRSFARSPGTTALMIIAIALGIGVSVVTVSVYHLLSGNPIWWKNDRLYAVTMDSYPLVLPPALHIPHLEAGPPRLTYRDATYLFSSDIPRRKVIMYSATGALTGGSAQHAPVRVTTRVTTPDFFAMFDVPFLYGGPWSASADFAGAPVIVLSREENERIFGGANSVGRTLRWNDHIMRVVGVLDSWAPLPRFYDVEYGAIEPPEDSYVDWRWAVANEVATTGALNCMQPEKFVGLASSECVWIYMWVELPDARSRARMQALLDNYWAEQRKAGRFARPRNNRLTNVGTWLSEHEMLADDNRIMVGVGIAFFAVCMLNVLGLLLARFLNRAPVTGVRRALGASRRQIVLQHLTEAGLLAVLGALLGLVVAELCLHSVYALIVLMRSADTAVRARFDLVSLWWTLALAVIATLGAGVYPALRAGWLPPAAHLKNQ